MLTKNKTLYRRAAALAMALAVTLSGLTAANALDVADVQNLIRNQVPEEVIVSMVESDGSMYITMEEANVLRSLGASENLIKALRPTATTLSTQPSATYVAEPPADIVPLAAPAVQPAPVVAVQAAAPVMQAEGSPIMPVNITTSSAYPPRYEKEGWLSISNRDWTPYFLNVNAGDKRLFLSRAPNGGMVIQSGENVVINLRKETYKMYGDSGKELKIRVRENETTTLSLNPYGVFGNSGLTGVATDRDRVRSEVLFANYVPAPTVIVQEPPVIVVPGPRPPVYYGRPHYYRPYRGGVHFGYGRYGRW